MNDSNGCFMKLKNFRFHTHKISLMTDESLGTKPEQRQVVVVGFYPWIRDSTRGCKVLKSSHHTTNRTLGGAFCLSSGILTLQKQGWRIKKMKTNPLLLARRTPKLHFLGFEPCLWDLGAIKEHAAILALVNMAINTAKFRMKIKEHCQ